MGYSIKILLDSINETGNRLTTFELTYPRFIHAAVMSYRMPSRNGASSRAIPVAKMIQRVIDDPAMPLVWGANKSGMQAGGEIVDVAGAKVEWLRGRDEAVKTARRLMELGLHKQHANRVLEPYMWMTTIMTANQAPYEHIFYQRCDDGAQPEFMFVACEMRTQLEMSTPTLLGVGQWHCPLMNDVPGAGQFGERDAMISAGRCARVSYLTHDGRTDTDADHALAERLIDDGHWSPFEHVARPIVGRCRNFQGWEQFRNVLEM